MKKKNILLIFLLVSVVLVFVILLLEFNVKTINGMSEFRYSYYGGFSTEGNTYYDIKCDDKCIGQIDIEGRHYDEITIDKNTINKLVKIMNKYNISKWDGFNKSIDATDGNGFSLEIKTNDNETITAEGYLRFPNNHAAFHGDLVNLFSKYVEDVTGNKIDIIDKYEEKTHRDNNDTGYKKFYIDSLDELKIFNDKFDNIIDIYKVDFDENVILVENVTRGSGSDVLFLKDIYVKNKKIEFDIEDYSLKNGTMDMTYWYLIAVVKKDDLRGLDIDDWVEPSSLE